MKAYKLVKRPLKRYTTLFRTPTKRKMSFFPGSFFASTPASQTSYHPLFRLLDDFEQHSKNNPTNSASPDRSTRLTMKSFTPKFDVKELADAYELHGDLPGIDQNDVEIEFTDIQTITVRGHTERSYTSGTPPTASIEGGATQAAIEGAESSSSKSHKATVEDEDAGAVVAPDKKNTQVAQKEAPKPEAKYWVSERSVGEFSRSFTFPVRVDQDAVKASMKNGVLTVIVPKAKKHEARKITIA
ncbi:30 kDa heat shock protein [Diplocarpon rosae]|nr:30 kDa heat shock protein [Diplocarpon rosae]